MKLEPVITEKSLEDAKNGKYTFLVDISLNKYKIRKLIEDVFEVQVKKVRTISSKGETKYTLQRRKKIIKPTKKAIVELKGDAKIDIFEVKE